MKKGKKSLILILIIIEIITMTLTIKSYSNKNVINKVEENKIERKQFAIYIEETEGNYIEYNGNEFPSSGYKYNVSKSECLDINNNVLEDILSYNEGKITVVSSKTAYCYVYFDKKASLSDLCSSGENLGSCLTDNNSEIDSLNDNIEGGLYRYQGTQAEVNDNYICFGTTDKNECINNTDAYMYRVMGVNESGQLKLIKKEALNTEYAWHTSSSTDTTWLNSSLYNSLNGNSFLNDTTYVPSGWNNKIATTTWKYGDNTNINVTAENLYNIENGWTNTINAKIGLMYAHDYAYASQNGGQNCSAEGNYTSCLSAWLHLNNCDSNAPNAYEWIMSRRGYLDSAGYYTAYFINSNGRIHSWGLTPQISVRPTFYLTKDETYISGNGTKDDPIIIGKPSAGEEIIAKKPSGLDTTTSYSGLYRYIGTDVNNYVDIGGVSYRIIGITSEDNSTLGLEAGQLKVIKTDSIGTYNWHTSYSVNATWNTGGTDAAIYTYLNDTSVLGNTSVVPSGWSDKIDSVKWNVGNVKTYTDASTIIDLEDDSTTSENSKIGLMYLSDYYYAYNNGGTQNCYNSPYCVSWMRDSSATQWTMINYGSYSANGGYYAWRVGVSGNIGNAYLTNTYAVRPVFYLNSDVGITSGMGTSSDPFILQ